jgi:lipopolysaccharide/colanic/teichoic acid biosynthesis glycosyltransferase
VIRFFDIIFSLLGLIILLPVFTIVAIWIKLDSKGPVFYKQTRVGRYGIDYKLFKFRSMLIDADKSGLLTVGGKDPRVTTSGYFIRKYKLDELPQLLNVLSGEMSLVGPRPEVRKYVDMYSSEQLGILSIRPGITDWASIAFRNENEMLGKSNDPEKTYIEDILPRKIELNQIFIQNRSVLQYFKIILNTIFNFQEVNFL